MVKRVRHVNAVLLLLQTAVNDARMLNIARSIRADGGSVILLAYGSEQDVKKLAEEGIELIAIGGSTDARLMLRWPFFLAKALYSLRSISADAFWAEDIFSLWPAAKLAKKTGARLIYDSRELYFALGTLSEGDARQKLIQSLEERYFPVCDAVVVTGPLDADELRKRYGGPRATTLLNVPPLKIAERTNRIHDQFGIKHEQKILVYQGGVFRAKGLALAVRALVELHDCVLCIIGDGPYERNVRELATELKVLDRVVFTGRLPYDELLAWTAAADIGLSLIEATTLSYQLALPNKMFEYCMAGIPTLASDLPAMRRTITDFGIGCLAAQTADAAAVAAIVREMLETDRMQQLRAACEAARKELNWQVQSEVVLQVQKGNAH